VLETAEFFTYMALLSDEPAEERHFAFLLKAKALARTEPLALRRGDHAWREVHSEGDYQKP